MESAKRLMEVEKVNTRGIEKMTDQKQEIDMMKMLDGKEEETQK